MQTLKNFTLGGDNLGVKTNISEYFQRKSSLVHVPPDLQVSVHLMPETPFYD